MIWHNKFADERILSDFFNLIWSWCNMFLFEDGFFLPFDFSGMSRILFMVEEPLKDHNIHVLNPELVLWHPLPMGWVKLNSNGASCGNPGKAGCGDVLISRTQDGEGFSKRLGKCDAYEAELWGIIIGLEIARKDGFRQVLVESDSLNAVQRLDSCLDEPRSPFLWRV